MRQCSEAALQLGEVDVLGHGLQEQHQGAAEVAEHVEEDVPGNGDREGRVEYRKVDEHQGDTDHEDRRPPQDVFDQVPRRDLRVERLAAAKTPGRRSVDGHANDGEEKHSTGVGSLWSEESRYRFREDDDRADDQHGRVRPRAKQGKAPVPVRESAVATLSGISFEKPSRAKGDTVAEVVNGI